jgi:hypothetical protein
MYSYKHDLKGYKLISKKDSVSKSDSGLRRTKSPLFDLRIGFMLVDYVKKLVIHSLVLCR